MGGVDDKKLCRAVSSFVEDTSLVDIYYTQAMTKYIVDSISVPSVNSCFLFITATENSTKLE